MLIAMSFFCTLPLPSWKSEIFKTMPAWHFTAPPRDEKIHFPSHHFENAGCFVVHVVQWNNCTLTFATSAFHTCAALCTCAAAQRALSGTRLCMKPSEPGSKRMFLKLLPLYKAPHTFPPSITRLIHTALSLCTERQKQPLLYFT